MKKLKRKKKGQSRKKNFKKEIKTKGGKKKKSKNKEN